ncbi:hypothetical protein F8S13_19350 [Chloroflexia bacterium SDU3-3]|nr:hypothetical protein F8S13_19350 [Chloroflexia bacterium SDU3-3]
MTATARALPRTIVIGSAWMLLLTIIGGIIGGVLLGLLAQVVYLVFIFPVMLGAVCGGIVTQMARKRKVAIAPFVMLCAVVMALIAYMSYHGTSYALFTYQASDQLAKDYPDSTPEQRDRAIQQSLYDTTGFSGVLGFLSLSASSGITIGSMGGAHGIMPLVGPFVWGYWVVELGIVVTVSGLIARGESKKRFCYTCGEWYRGENIGTIRRLNQEQIVQLMRLQEWKALDEAIEETDASGYDVYCEACECSYAPVLLTATYMGSDMQGRPRVVDIASAEVPADFADTFRLAH